MNQEDASSRGKPIDIRPYTTLLEREFPEIPVYEHTPNSSEFVTHCVRSVWEDQRFWDGISCYWNTKTQQFTMISSHSTITTQSERDPLRKQSEKELIRQQALLATAVLLAPPQARSSFLNTVGNVLLRTVDYDDLITTIRRTAYDSSYSFQISIPFQMQTEHGLKDLVQYCQPILFANETSLHVFKRNYFVPPELYQQLLNDPFVAIRYKLYTFFSGTEGVLYDGIRGQYKIMNELFKGLVIKIYQTNPNHPLFSGDVAVSQQTALSLFSSNDFYTALIQLTRAANGFIMPKLVNTRTMHACWDIDPDGTMHVSQHVITQLKESLTIKNRSVQLLGNTIQYRLTDPHLYGTSSGCPVSHKPPHQSFFSRDPFSIKYMPANALAAYHLNEQIGNPIDKIYFGTIQLANDYYNKDHTNESS